LFRKIKFVDRALTNLEHVLDVNEDRCVRLKHKRSTCQVCVTNCPTEAIKVGKIREHIVIDWEKCVACGICTNVCSTEVFRLKQFTDRDLLERSRGVIQANKNLEIRCCKVSDKPVNFAIEVNCLGLINSAHIVALAAYGAEALHFRHADCENCEAKWGKKHVLQSIKASQYILKAYNINNSIILSTGKHIASFTIPSKDDHLVDKEKVLSRREFFQYFKRQTKLSAGKTISLLWDIESKQARRPVGVSQKFVPIKRRLLLASLQTSEAPDENPLDTSESSTLTSLELDPSKCGLCESCARFCPTGALTQQTVRDRRGKKIEAELKFNPAKCVKCDLCLDACFTKALKYDDQLNKNLLLEECDLLLISQ